MSGREKVGLVEILSEVHPNINLFNFLFYFLITISLFLISVSTVFAYLTGSFTASGMFAYDFAKPMIAFGWPF